MSSPLRDALLGLLRFATQSLSANALVLGGRQERPRGAVTFDAQLSGGKEKGVLSLKMKWKRGVSTSHPLVGIIMGSASDASVMDGARRVLREFGVPFEFKVVSAHRTPDRMFRYAEDAAGRGIEVIIAGAGGAAHLPGMIASKTSLPVIGVPVRSRTMDGLDSLLSIAQMPKGVPVATVAVDNAANAALLAIRILGIKYPSLVAKTDSYREEMKQQVLRTRL